MIRRWVPRDDRGERGFYPYGSPYLGREPGVRHHLLLLEIPESGFDTIANFHNKLPKSQQGECPVLGPVKCLASSRFPMAIRQVQLTEHRVELNIAIRSSVSDVSDEENLGPRLHFLKLEGSNTRCKIDA